MKARVAAKEIIRHYERKRLPARELARRLRRHAELIAGLEPNTAAEIRKLVGP